MTIKLPNLDIYYDSCPKNACTSVRSWLYHLGFKKQFKNYIKNGTSFHIHNYLRDESGDNSKKFILLKSKKIDDSLIRSKQIFCFCIIRDPLKSFLSAYSNRVTYHKELSLKNIPEQKFLDAGLKPDPELNYFVNHLEEYQLLQPTILHHTKPMTDFLDSRMSYTHIYETSNLDILVEDVKSFLDRKYSFDVKMIPEMPRYQTGGNKFSLDELSPRNFNKLVNTIYQSDYEYITKLKLKYPNRIENIGYELLYKEYSNILHARD